jgi:hypothetical protein
MPFYLSTLTFLRTHQLKVEIDAEKYEKIIAAWDSLHSIANIEEVWDCLIQNYLELEKELIESALYSMVIGHRPYHQFQQIRLGFSRRLANLLQSCRSYLDHTPHHLNSVNGERFSEQFCVLTNRAYDKSFSYKFMEALRNYAQHRDLPLHGATFNFDRVSGVDKNSPEDDKFRHIAAANINLSIIRNDTYFKKSILDEIDKNMKTLDVMQLTRDYIEQLGGVHEGLRKVMQNEVTEWKKVIRSTIAGFMETNNCEVDVLHVTECDDGIIISRTEIFEDMLLRIDELTKRNGSLINLGKRYVSNELIRHQKALVSNQRSKAQDKD